jgi:hypothetical protein
LRRAAHLQLRLELRWVRHRDLEEQHRVVGGNLVALALLVLLLDVLQDVPGVRLIGDDAELTLASCLLDKAPGGPIQLDLGHPQLGGPGDP